MCSRLDTTERRQILAEYVERDIGRRVALQVKSIGAVLLAAADASASTLAKEFAEPVSGPAAPVERLLTALYEALAPAINEKKNPVATLLLQLQMRLDRNPGAVSRTLGEKLIEHIQFHQALPVDFASGDWALRETLKAAKELVNEEAGMARYAGMSAIATLASKYEKGSLSEVDFKAQLLHLEVCPVLADVVRRLLFNNGPIVLPVTLAAAAVAFKDVDPVSAKRCEELDSAVVTFFRSPGLPPSSRRLLHLFVCILLFAFAAVPALAFVFKFVVTDLAFVAALPFVLDVGTFASSILALRNVAQPRCARNAQILAKSMPVGLRRACWTHRAIFSAVSLAPDASTTRHLGFGLHLQCNNTVILLNQALLLLLRPFRGLQAQRQAFPKRRWVSNSTHGTNMILRPQFAGL